MQSSSSILDFTHSPSKITSKQKFENQTFMKQQIVDKSNICIPTNDQTSEENKAPNSGVTTNLFYKIGEIFAWSSATFSTISDTYNTLTAAGAIEPETSTRKRKGYNNGYGADVMQINDDNSDGAYDNDEMSDGEMGYNSEEISKKIDKKVDRKNEVKWSVNDDEEEPPPPYDSSWAMPKTNSGANSLTNAPMPSSPKHISFATPNVENKSSSPPKDTNSNIITIPRRRQIRVRRPRRLLRRKSTSTEVSTPRGGGGRYDDPDELLLKVNDKLSDMIEQGRAALTSTVDVTEVEMLMAEERERDERIMKELGLQTPVRKGRKNTADYDYFTSTSDGNYSSPEFDYGYGSYSGHGSGFVSPSGYESPDTYAASHGHYNTPSQFGSPGIYHQAQSGFNFPNLGFGINNNNNGNKFGENDFMNPIPNRYYGTPSSSSGFGGDHAIPKAFGAGPISGGFPRFGRHGPSFGTNYVPNFGSNAGGFGSNSFGPNGGYGTYNNNRGEYIY